MGGWLTPRPGRFTPGKETRYPSHRILRGPQRQSGRVGKILPPLGFDPRTVQPVASRFADRAIPAHQSGCSNLDKPTPSRGIISRFLGEVVKYPFSILIVSNV